MNNAIMAIAGAGAALMAASGAFSMGRLAAVGASVIFIAAAWKFVLTQRERHNERRHSGDRRHADTPMAMSSH